MSKRTMRPFEEMTPEVIGELRLRDASQAVLARYLQRDGGAGEPVGAWKEAPVRRFVEAPDAVGGERPRCGRLIAVGGMTELLTVRSSSENAGH